MGTIKTIKLEPPSFPQNSSMKRNVSRSSLVNVPENERCPHGSVPIRRPFKDELVRAAFPPPSRHTNHSSVNELPNTVHKYAVVIQASNGPRLTAVSAFINVWKPNTEQTSFSLAQLWAIYSTGTDIPEAVEVGWMVYPEKFGDQEPRFFIYFTNDGYNTGCYNLDCPGFVQVSRDVCLGCIISPYSTYNGAQFEIDVGITQTTLTKDWWVRWNDIFIGYYPYTMFPRLSQGGATDVEWGGEVTQSPQASRPTTTHMGSGHFPDEGLNRAAFFRNMKYEDTTFEVYSPNDAGVTKYVSHPECYGLSSLVDSQFFYGGSGGGAPGCI
ncbi:hypothetical protein V2J09_008274 [Rumex salicifolius]